MFGGEFPPAELIGRFYMFHILLLPLLMIGAITVHLGIVFLQKHTQFPGGRATETNVVGRHLWPGQAFRSFGLFFVTAAVLALMGGLVQINPVWVYGPYVPSAAVSPAQPDWYLGWLEGALRYRTELGADDPRRHDPQSVPPRDRPARDHLRRSRPCGPSSRDASTATAAITIFSSTPGRRRSGSRSAPLC